MGDVHEIFSTDITAFWFKDEMDRDDQRENVMEIDLMVDDPQEAGASMHLLDAAANRVANPDCFPPTFVRNRLVMFAEEFPMNKEWIRMHRGLNVYRDFLADFYEVIHEEFILKLYGRGYVQDDDLKRFVNFLEMEGYRGILQCQRDGGYCQPQLIGKVRVCSFVRLGRLYRFRVVMFTRFSVPISLHFGSKMKWIEMINGKMSWK